MESLDAATQLPHLFCAGNHGKEDFPLNELHPIGYCLTSGVQFYKSVFYVDQNFLTVTWGRIRAMPSAVGGSVPSVRQAAVP